jgi:large subunit ribosomal protein L22
MMATTRTNERPGTRAQVRHVRMSAYKAREVLDLIRGLPVDEADQVLQFTERAVAKDVRKVLTSAIANAAHNDGQTDESTLYVSACYADEGPTLKRWRPRARGRATRIRKRTCHITIIVGQMPAEMLELVENQRSAAEGRGGGRPRGVRAAAAARRARVLRSRRQQGEDVEETEEAEEAEVTDEVEADEAESVTPPEDDEVEVEVEEEDEPDPLEELEAEIAAEEAEEDDDADDEEEKK